MKTFSERLILAITVSGLRHIDVVKASGISATHFSHITRGNREPNLENLALILKALPGIDARWLVCGGKQ